MFIFYNYRYGCLYVKRNLLGILLWICAEINGFYGQISTPGNQVVVAQAWIAHDFRWKGSILQDFGAAYVIRMQLIESCVNFCIKSNKFDWQKSR